MGRLKIISYAELFSLWKRGLRNGSLRRMPRLKQGLLSGALAYARMTGAIVNSKLIASIKAIAVNIRLRLGERIFFGGLERASAFARNMKLMQTFKVVGKWINNYAYLFWLGTDSLVNKRKWLLV